MNTHTLRTPAARVRPRSAILPVVLALALPGLARATSDVNADAVAYWSNQSNLAALRAGTPPIQARFNAISHVAMHDALNSIEVRYQTYAGLQQARPGASPNAAVAAAAFVAVYPQVPANATVPGNPQKLYRQHLKDTYDAYIAGLADSCAPAYPDCVADGVAVGTAAAVAILAMRDGDGSATPHADYPVQDPAPPGVYVRTPGSAPPQFGNWGKLKPFVLNHGAQFRPWSPLLDLDSETFARDYEEVRLAGNDAMRIAALSGTDALEKSRSQSTPFWAGGGGNVNTVAQNVVHGHALDLWQRARLYALINLAQADASIALFNAKYHYNFWRPITAIRTLDDPAWQTYLQPTPPYPDYPSGLSSLVASGAQVLRMYFGKDEMPFDMTINGVTRSFDTLSEAEMDAGMSRVYGGIHFRSACVDGIALGNKVGRFVYLHALKPL